MSLRGGDKRIGETICSSGGGGSHVTRRDQAVLTALPKEGGFGWFGWSSLAREKEKLERRRPPTK